MPSVPSTRLAALAPSASLRSSAQPLRVRVAGCGLRPAPASAPRPALVSALLRALLPSPSAACFARLPSAPPHRPPLSRRGGSRPPGPPAPHPLSLVPLVLPFPTAYAGSGSHTPRSELRVCASRTYGRRLSAQPPPSAVTILLDRAYVVPIHAGHPAPGHAGLRLSCTGTRAIHACRYRKHGPIHNRHAHMMAASATHTPRIEGAFAEIATSPPIW